MKRYILITCFIFGLMTSCNVLDQLPEQQISDSQAITSLSGANAALNGAYSQIQGVYEGRLQRLSDVSADVSQSIGTWDFYREMDTYAVSPDNTELLDLWTFIYRAVNQANNLIEGTPGLTATQAQKDNIIGQAYFIRALAHFDAVRVWGGVPNAAGTLGVPIVLTPSRGIGASAFPSRATLPETYQQVKADLDQALALLPEDQSSNANTRGRATKNAVRALLSRVHLYLGEWAQAEARATEIISNTTKFSLVPYATIFTGDNTNESILEIQFNTADQSGLRFWYAPGALGGRGELAVHDGFYNSFAASDARRAMFGRDDVVGVWYISKYLRAGNIDDGHVLRLAEMYLNRAEARARQSNNAGAEADLNAVRTRAGLLNYNPGADIPLLEAIERERRWEFFGEGHTFFDLVRTGRALAVLQNVTRKNGPPVNVGNAQRLVMPIPRREVDANKNLIQNQGYN
ncbi:MAG: RagB/SusD family nutrient uptake outer membrane protein [Chryseotalea sp. WA131a]|nr:MAG: RagB/SusD family nutrient uptake outer membrane protein [Chryseotalea sp. WA131a]